ncbi:MAG: hypothetical protein NTX50_01140 [Candidatus Sumerlaeota bacterium]|nr:hypothetical protein [Candidatus Sumerlaeota bacterium]
MKMIARYFSIALIAVILMGSTGCFFSCGSRHYDQHKDSHDERNDRR